jgi:hypothetical protein
MRNLRLTAPLLMLLSLTACSNATVDDASKEPTTAATPAAPPSVSAAPAAAPKPAAAKPVTVPSGAEFNVVLESSLSSSKSKAGDTFEATLSAPVYADGKTVFEKGDKVMGKVVDADDGGRVKGLANLRLTLTSVTHNGKEVSLTTKDFISEAEASKGRDAAMVAGGAGLGAAIGAIAGGKKGAATGAAIGGAGGAGTVLATKGKQVEFPIETTLTFSLDKDVSVVP